VYLRRFNMTTTSTCPSCNGSGSHTVYKGGWEITSNETCPVCDGTGYITTEEDD